MLRDKMAMLPSEFKRHRLLSIPAKNRLSVRPIEVLPVTVRARRVRMAGRRPLPSPPGANPPLPRRRQAQLPPEPVYDVGEPPAELPPVGRPARPLPAQPSIEFNGPDENYDDFSSPAPGPPQDTYDDFGEAPVKLKQKERIEEDEENPYEADDPATYDEMNVGPPVSLPPRATPAAVVSPYLPQPDVPLPTLDGEVYDEPDDSSPMSRKMELPPLPPAQKASPVVQVSPPSEQEWEGETYEICNDNDGEIYQDPDEEAQQQISSPPALPKGVSPPALPPARATNIGRPPISLQSRPTVPSNDIPEGSVYELDSDSELENYGINEDEDPKPLAVHAPPLPSRPTKPEAKKASVQARPAGLDLSQILNAKLRPTNGPTKAANQTKTEETNQIVDFRNKLKKTPVTARPAEDTPKVAIVPLAPWKKTNTAEDQTDRPTPPPPRNKPEVKVQPLSPMRNTNDETAEQKPIKVQVSPPISDPPTTPRKKSIPDIAPVKPSAFVKPEKHVPETPLKKPESPPSIINNNNDNTDQERLMSQYTWYHGAIDREVTERLLRAIGGDGVFLVRKSKKGSAEQPYTMAILFEDHVFSLKIRCRPSDGGIVLGEEKTGEISFSSVASLVSFHKDKNVTLIGNPGGKTKLLSHPIRK